MGTIHLAGKFSCFEKKWEKEITLDQSKSLENVKIEKKTRAARNNKKEIQGNPLMRGSVSFSWFKDSAAADENTEHCIRSAQATAERQGAHPTPSIKALSEKKNAGFLVA